MQEIGDGLALHLSTLVSRLKRMVDGARGFMVVDLDWWLRHAVLAYAEKEYVQLVADNGLFLVIDLRPLSDGRAPYYVVDRLGGGGVCAEA